MISNYLRLGWRNILRQKLYSGINIGGLALGLAVGILLLIWVQDELSYDKFHKNGEQIYRASVTFTSGKDVQTWTGLPAPLGAHAVKEIPGVESFVRIRGNWGSISKLTYGDKDFFDVNCAYTDASFFTFFSFPLIRGNVQHPFPDNASVVLTRSTAKKYFGTDNAIGKVLRVNDKTNYTVTGIIEDFPEQSSIRFDFLLPYGILAQEFGKNTYWGSLDGDWGDFFFDTYLRLSPNALPGKVAAQLARLRPDSKPDPSMRYNIQPLKDMHLYNPDQSEGSIKIVRIFLIIAIVILLIACVNYVNLSTARAIQRAGEIGVRKMIGATRGQLFMQFLWESVLVFLLSLVLALIMIVLVIPFYSNLTDKHLSLTLHNLQLIVAIGLSMLLTLVVAGIYPAVLLSSFNPLKALKGRLAPGSGNISFRKALVVVQFLIATVLIVSTLVVAQQLSYIRHKELGYNKENVFTFASGGMGEHIASAVDELSAVAGVAGVSTANQDLIHVDNSTGDTEWDGKEKDASMIFRNIGTDKDFLSVMKLQLVAGQNFFGNSSDSARYIVNETAVRMMGMKDPVGKRFRLWSREGIIAGVVKDFHYSSLHERIGPLVFYYQPNSWKIYVRTTGKDTPKAIAVAEKLYKRYNEGYPFSYSFVDQDLDKMYHTDQRTGRLFNYFAGIAIFISCLGLFGLATFATGQRIKEIGVRKVLGASITNIITLLTTDFMKIVCVAILVAIPIAWYTMDKWLQDYAYRIAIQWWVFGLAGGIAVMVALCTVSFQAVKAALMNPVRSLKTE